MPKTVHEYRTIKLKNGLIVTVESWLKTPMAKKLGIDTITEAVDYFTKKGLRKISKY